MKPTLVCIFAHPDDEAFGPGGSIATFTKTHNVYILCATKGEAGQSHNPAHLKKIASVRSQEIKRSAAILGVKKVFFLGFKDGTLCNNLYHKLADAVEEKLQELKPETILTYEPRGISGHIDHITVSMVSSFVFEKLDFIKQVYYYCLDEEHRNAIDKYFIYFPPGYTKKEIDKTIDVSEVWETKLKAMYEHKSQQHDIDRILSRTLKLPKVENFMIRTK
jgi:LmbE family N-acetylglucosaminyl deacetylase